MDPAVVLTYHCRFVIRPGGGGSVELAARRQLVGSSSCGVIFFCFFQRATLSGGEPTVLAVPITIELDQTMLKTGGDVFLEPAVKGVNGVVLHNMYFLLCNL